MALVVAGAPADLPILKLPLMPTAAAHPPMAPSHVGSFGELLGGGIWAQIIVYPCSWIFVSQSQIIPSSRLILALARSHCAGGGSAGKNSWDMLVSEEFCCCCILPLPECWEDTYVYIHISILLLYIFFVPQPGCWLALSIELSLPRQRHSHQ